MTTDNLREDVFFNRLIGYQTTFDYMMAKVRGIFAYEGLPATVPAHVLEQILTEDGGAVLYLFEDDLFVTRTRPHSHPDVYGRNTHVTIEHTVDGKTTTLERVIGIDAVEILSDPSGIGLTPLVTEYSILHAQAKLSMLRAFVDLRSSYFIQAKDENSRRSALEFENALRRGDTAVLFAEEFETMDGVVVHNVPTTGSTATQLIELTQYVNSQYYSDLGISVQNNMKREYVNEAEMETPNGAALVWVMEHCRRLAFRDVKALFGIDVDVKISSNWSNQDDAAADPADDPADEQDDQAAAEDDAAAVAAADPDDEADETTDETDEITDEADEDLSREELIEATEAMTGETDDDAH